MIEMISKIWEKIISLKNQYLIIVAALILCITKYIFYIDVQACIDSFEGVIKEGVPMVYNFGEKVIKENLFYNFSKVLLDLNVIIIGIMIILALGCVITFYIDNLYKYKYYIEKTLNYFFEIGIILFNIYIIFILIANFLFNKSIIFIPSNDIRIMPFAFWLMMYSMAFMNKIYKLKNEE